MAFGPIDLIALEFKGNIFHDETLSYLAELVSEEIIRILDLVIIHKDWHGEITIQELEEVESSISKIFDPLKPEISMMITVDDIMFIGKKFENDTTAAILLCENLWTVKLNHDLTQSGGRMVMDKRIRRKVVSDAIEDLAELD